MQETNNWVWLETEPVLGLVLVQSMAGTKWLLGIILFEIYMATDRFKAGKRLISRHQKQCHFWT